MKRYVSLFLLFSYLLSSPGLVYSMHFCGQALTAVTVTPDADKQGSHNSKNRNSR